MCFHVCIFIYIYAVAQNTVDSEEPENIPGLKQGKMVISVLYLVLSLISNTLAVWYLLSIEA